MITKMSLPVSQISGKTFTGLPKTDLITARMLQLAKNAGSTHVSQALVDRIYTNPKLQGLFTVDEVILFSPSHLFALRESLVVVRDLVEKNEATLDLVSGGELDWRNLILEAGERVRGKYRIDLEILRAGLISRNLDPKLADEFLQLYSGFNKLTSEIENLRSQQKIKFTGKPTAEEVAQAKARGEKIKAEIASREQNLDELRFSLAKLTLSLPNFPHESVPVGPDASANQVVRSWGEPTRFSFEPKDHVAIGEELGILDFARGARLAQTRFVAHRGAGAKMERSLIQFMLNLHTQEHGYTEWWLPELVNSKTMFGTGQFPNFSEQMFSCNLDDLHLIPTAEVPLTNLHAGEILDAGELPKRYTAYTSCFRREAGAAGRDVRGMIRVHQFDKVELVSITKPDQSFIELERMVSCAEEVLKRLGLPYRTVLLSTGDMGGASAKTYDLEVWLPSQNRWLEISSCSNCTDWQSRRMETRFKGEKSKPQSVHTLNGSGVAVGRTLVAILENYQQQDGTVVIPEALRPYMQAERISR